MLCELRRYQEWGVKYILHQERVLLGDEMGLGKTVQAIATIHFKHKPIEGSPDQNKDVAPDELILDGQQRLTSLYNALYSKSAVHTKTDKGKLINRFSFGNLYRTDDK